MDSTVTSWRENELATILTITCLFLPDASTQLCISADWDAVVSEVKGGQRGTERIKADRLTDWLAVPRMYAFCGC